MFMVIILKILKFLGKVYAVWPLDQNARKNWSIVYQFLWWFYFTNYVLALFFTLNTCYQGRHDIELLTFSWMEVMAIIEPLIVLINYKYYVNLLQFLLNRTEDYMKAAGPERKSYLKERGAIFAIMMAFILLLYSVLILLYFTNPAVTPWETFLTTAYYPPPIRSSSILVLLYFHQLVVLFHTSVMVVFDIIVVTLIYSCTVRLKILSDQFREAKSFGELINCVREHQHILTMSYNTNKVVRFVVLKTVLCFIGYAVGAGLQIINPQATTVSLKRFGVVLLINSTRLIMIALSADDLSSTSLKVGSSIFSTAWYEDDKQSVIAKKLVILRCQNIAKVSVSGFMPALSLSYITSIISTAISYFTTLRAVTRS